MTESPGRQYQVDAEHLRLLSLFHYLMAGLAGLCGCFPILHLGVGLWIALVPSGSGPGGPPPAVIGWLFALIALGVMILMWGMAVAIWLSAGYLSRRQHWTFCVVVAGLLCLQAPFGTVLGVFTIIVLMRESVKRQFGEPVP